jgi:cytochrome P450
MTNSIPPGPKARFFGLNHVRHMQRDLLGFFVQQARDFGDIVAYQCGPVRMFQFTHPDHVQEILVRQARKFEKPDRLKDVFGQWDGQGLLTSDGDLWTRQRRLIQPAFHPRRVQSYAETIVADADKMLDDWGARAEINVVDEMMRVTLSIVGHVLFGSDLDDEVPAIATAVDMLQEVAMVESGRVIPLPSWLPVRIHRRRRIATKTIHGLVDRLIQRRRAVVRGSHDPAQPSTEGLPPDLLSLLLTAVDSETDGRGMSDIQARDEATTLLLAGHETTAVSLMWTLYFLALHPANQDCLATQVAEATAGRDPTTDNLPQMASVELAIKESMRLRGPVYVFGRQAAEPVEIAGVQIPRGSQVYLLPYVTHHDPRWWPEPDEFRPERFTPDLEAQRPQFAYFPFGGGPRVCIGKGLAMLEATLIIAAILKRYRFALAAGQGDPGLEAQVSLHPRGPLRMTFELRR